MNGLLLPTGKAILLPLVKVRRRAIWAGNADLIERVRKVMSSMDIWGLWFERDKLQFHGMSLVRCLPSGAPDLPDPSKVYTCFLAYVSKLSALVNAKGNH